MVLVILKWVGDFGLCSVSIFEVYEGMGFNFKINILIFMVLFYGLFFVIILGV